MQDDRLKLSRLDSPFPEGSFPPGSGRELPNGTIVGEWMSHEEYFAMVEALFLSIRDELARHLDRCSRLLHPDRNNANRDLLDFSPELVANKLELLHGEMARFFSLVELALETEKGQFQSLNLGDLERLCDYCRNLRAADGLLAQRLRPLLLASWRLPDDPWRLAGLHCQAYHRQHFETLNAFARALRAQVNRRLGIDEDSSGFWEMRVDQGSSFDQLLLQLDHEHLPLERLVDWVRRALVSLEEVQARVVFAVLLPRLFDEVALAPTMLEVESVERILAEFSCRDFFERRPHSDGIVELSEQLRAQRNRWGRGGLSPGTPPRAKMATSSTDDRAFEDALAHLPAAVQQSLARQGRFLEIFATHGDYQVAREVIHFLHANNIGRVLGLRDVNRRLLEDLLRWVDLAALPELLTLALCNPQCPLVFASKNLTSLSSSQLHQIIQVPSAHPEIKRKAMLETIRRRNSQKASSHASVVPLHPNTLNS